MAILALLFLQFKFVCGLVLRDVSEAFQAKTGVFKAVTD